MLSHSLRLTSLLLLLSIIGCASNTNSINSTQVEQENKKPVLATAIQPSYRTQVELLRLEQMMAQVHDNPLQLSRLYYERGTVYDRVGLHTLARLDFSRALKLRPSFAEAYNFIGVYLTLEQQYGTAFQAFDSALELSPTLEYAYLNRGIALHYSGKNKLALADMNSFLTLSDKDPYRVLWHYLIQNELNSEQAMTELSQRYLDRLSEHYLNVEDEDWGWKIVGVLVNKIDEQQLLTSMNNGQIPNNMLADRLCELYFYMAKQKLKHDPQLASYYFKLAVATNVYEFIEHRYALLELDLLKPQKH